MQTLFKPTCVLVGGAGRSGTTILGSLLASHPQAAVLIEGSLTEILCSVQMLVSIRSAPEESERTAMFGVPKSFVHGSFDSVRAELEQLADMPSYRSRFEMILRTIMELCSYRQNARVFGSKSTIDEHWEDIGYLSSILDDLRLILIVRHPVNVIASSLRRRDNARIGRDIWHINSAEEAAAEWRAAMCTMARVIQDRTHPTLIVKYEELCSEPSLVQDIFSFSGLSHFEAYPALWRLSLGETRLTLTREDASYLDSAFPGIDALWEARSPQQLLKDFAAGDFGSATPTELASYD